MDQVTVDSITAGVDYGTILIGMGGVAATIMAIIVAARGVKYLFSLVKGG